MVINDDLYFCVWSFKHLFEYVDLVVVGGVHPSHFKTGYNFTDEDSILQLGFVSYDLRLYLTPTVYTLQQMNTVLFSI